MEIAEALDIKLGTVRSRIHRARAMLRESLADRAPNPPAAPPARRRRLTSRVPRLSRGAA